MNRNYETLLHRWFEEVWNERREESVDELFAPDGVAHGLVDAEGQTVCGREKFKQLQRAFIDAFPDLRITVEDAFSEGDKIAARCRVTATHAGGGLGVAPTNNPVEFTGLAIVRVEDGKIVEAWNEFDFMKMYAQVGALQLNLSPGTDG